MPQALASSETFGALSEFLGKAVYVVTELEVKLLDPPRCSHSPAPVAEVTLELAHYARDGEAAEGGPPVWIESIDGFDQRQRGNLHEVVVRLAPIGEAAR